MKSYFFFWKGDNLLLSHVPLSARILSICEERAHQKACGKGGILLINSFTSQDHVEKALGQFFLKQISFVATFPSFILCSYILC
jgi:hypothetical protein